MDASQVYEVKFNRWMWIRTRMPGHFAGALLEAAQYDVVTAFHSVLLRVGNLPGVEREKGGRLAYPRHQMHGDPRT